MIEITRQPAQQTTVIRPATGTELADYERQKLAGIEDGAQKNRIESIAINNQRLLIDPNSKEVNISLGNLAFKSRVTPEDISSEKSFFIKCDLD